MLRRLREIEKCKETTCPPVKYAMSPADKGYRAL